MTLHTDGGLRPPVVLGAMAAVRAEYQRHQHTPGVESGRHIDGSAQALGKRENDSVALPTSRPRATS